MYTPWRVPCDLNSLVQSDEELAAVGVWLVAVCTCHQAPVAEPKPAVELVLEGGAIDGVAG